MSNLINDISTAIFDTARSSTQSAVKFTSELNATLKPMFDSIHELGRQVENIGYTAAAISPKSATTRRIVTTGKALQLGSQAGEELGRNIQGAAEGAASTLDIPRDLQSIGDESYNKYQKLKEFDEDEDVKKTKSGRRKKRYSTQFQTASNKPRRRRK
jgi:hypothetical protein